jgi:uncharacterized protein (DUF362 family)
MKVAVYQSEISGYPGAAPFHPEEIYPECARIGVRAAKEVNSVYSAVRKTLALLDLDAEHYGLAQWNPLGVYISPGDRVLIKPNLVLHEFGAQLDANCLTTHGSVIRAIVDYAFLATGPEGHITIADSPLQGADFESIVSRNGIREIQEYYRCELHFEIEVVDLRQIHAVIDESSSLIHRIERLKGDPLGYEEIDLASASRLTEIDNSHPTYVVGDYDSAATNERHQPSHHEYVIAKSTLDADAVINLPKLKTHCKTGVTVCLKNLVGTVGSKDCLPHHRHGKANAGGDEFPANYPLRWFLSSRVYSALQGRVPRSVWRWMRSCAGAFLGAGTPINRASGEVRSNFFPGGGWHGNDTIWRAVDDLNQILFFYNIHEHRVANVPQRKYFALVDGIVAMEGNGPLRGDPKQCGVLMAGADPLAIDVAAATLMGFDWHKIRLLTGIAKSRPRARYSMFDGQEDKVQIASNNQNWRSLADVRNSNFHFQPPNGWRQFVEITECGRTASTDCSLSASKT